MNISYINGATFKLLKTQQSFMLVRYSLIHIASFNKDNMHTQNDDQVSIYTNVKCICCHVTLSCSSNSVSLCLESPASDNTAEIAVYLKTTFKNYSEMYNAVLRTIVATCVGVESVLKQMSSKNSFLILLILVLIVMPTMQAHSNKLLMLP